MYSIHYLVCVLVVFVFQCYCDDIPDEPMATNDQLFGKGRTCDFNFGGYTYEEMVRDIYHDAKFLGVGHLHKHRADFLPDLTMTAVPDNDEEIWGIAVIIPKEEYQAYVAKDKEGHIAVKTIEVKVNGELQKVDCNVGIANNQPKKETPLPENRRPTKLVKNYLINVCVKYAFPQPYCDKIRNLPTRD